MCRKTCIESLRLWRVKKIKLFFGVPRVWIEGKDFVIDCCFCMTNLQDVLIFEL